jgi:S1-C subfamily serine protease
MRKAIVLIAVVCVSFLAFGQGAGTYFDLAAPAIFHLELHSRGTIESAGNGFVICEPRVLVTAYHVATDSRFNPIFQMQVRNFNEKVGEMRVIYHDDRSDVAFLEAPPTAGCLPLGKDVSAGERVRSIGSLLGIVPVGDYDIELFSSDLYFSLAGEVTKCCVNYSKLVSRQIGNRWNSVAHANFPSWRGQSGSAIVDDGLNVRGVLVGGFGPNDTIFVPVQEIRNAIRRWKP